MSNLMILMEEKAAEEFPNKIHDAITDATYERLKFLGKGAFGKCYEIVNVATQEKFAGKLISKERMMKAEYREKIMQEVDIHKALNHPNIVGFHSFFDDPTNIFIVMELCRKRSLREFLKRRHFITVYESRYFMHQILSGVKYLHDNGVVHRDLKPGNLFLDDNMIVKIGDFGIATRVEREGELKQTLCGTPSYVAPEILRKDGHSFEVDIWALGCIMFALLVGRAPFQHPNKRKLYASIRRCGFKLPISIPKIAADLIFSMLQSDPARRPTAGQLFECEFFTCAPVPTSLPYLSMSRGHYKLTRDYEDVHNEQLKSGRHLCLENLFDPIKGFGITAASRKFHKDQLEVLHGQLAELLDSKIERHSVNSTHDFADPAFNPLLWITGWIHHEHGFGYNFNKDAVGVMMNSRLSRELILSNGKILHLIWLEGSEVFYTGPTFPAFFELIEKKKFMSVVKQLKADDLSDADANAIAEEDKITTPAPHLHTWVEFSHAMALHLSDGNVQFDFLDQQKIVLCPLTKAVTLIDANNNMSTFPFSTIAEHGCSNDLCEKLHDACEMLARLIKMLVVEFY